MHMAAIQNGWLSEQETILNRSFALNEQAPMGFKLFCKKSR